MKLAYSKLRCIGSYVVGKMFKMNQMGWVQVRKTSVSYTQLPAGWENGPFVEDPTQLDVINTRIKRILTLFWQYMCTLRLL
jgi:hypothetical protein